MRLSYAVELRYGVIADIARKVHEGEPIDLANGWFNWIWQGDANEMILRALPLAAVPPAVLNLTGPAPASVREVAGKLSALLGRPARFRGTEAPNALISNASLAEREFGPPPTALDTILGWTADWVRRGGRSLGKPTHFEVRDGAY
jgi:nucleoside-diphosphate-sugar epimerase